MRIFVTESSADILFCYRISGDLLGKAFRLSMHTTDDEGSFCKIKLDDSGFRKVSPLGFFFMQIYTEIKLSHVDTQLRIDLEHLPSHVIGG